MLLDEAAQRMSQAGKGAARLARAS